MFGVCGETLDTTDWQGDIPEVEGLGRPAGGAPAAAAPVSL